MPSPFSCFSPAYDETLPRHFGGGGIHDSQFPQHRERRNSPPGLTKLSIGQPYNFVHNGHVGASQAISLKTQADLTSALASITRALQSQTPATTSLPVPTIPIQPRPSSPAPFADVSNGQGPQKKRKPAPMVTPSVIRQAGKEVVDATGGAAQLKAKFIPPPPVPTLPTSTMALGEMTDVKDEEKVEMVEDVEIEEEREHTQTSLLPPSKNAPSDLTLNDSSSSPIRTSQDEKRDANLPYHTDTGKIRWDGAMKEIEDALEGC